MTSNLTNWEILEIFKKKFPKAIWEDYRPLCPEMYTDDLVGITIWLKNGDVIQYYPKEAQEKKE